jgi:hypothetical protein
MIVNEVSAKHKLGNMIAGLCGIVDGIVLFLSIGMINSQLCMSWQMYRRHSGVLCDNPMRKV